MEDAVVMREAKRSDLPRLLEIYNHYVVETHITFDLDPVTLERRALWLDAFGDRGPHRLFVAERDGLVEGYASSGVFRAKAAYGRSVETSIYLAPESGGRGVGTRLYRHLLEALDAEPEVHRAYGGVATPNDASIALHERCGFTHAGTFTEVGFKFDRYWDVVWFERVCR